MFQYVDGTWSSRCRDFFLFFRELIVLVFICACFFNCNDRAVSSDFLKRKLNFVNKFFMYK